MPVKEANTKKGGAPPPPLPPRHRPPRTTPTAKQTRHKKANPNAATPYNHRARFSRFKRRIHAERRWVVEHNAPQRAGSFGEQRGEKANATSSASAVPVSIEDAWEYTQPDTTPATQDGCLSSSSSASASSSPVVARAVKQMEALFGQLDAAVKQRRFGRAAHVRQSLRAHQHHLRRLLLSSKCTRETIETRATKVASTTAAVEEAAPSPALYRSFHPPSTWLGVGRHPHSEWVDQRTGRYPAACTTEQLHFVLRHCSTDGDEGVQHCGKAGMEEWVHRLPTLSPAAASTDKKKKEAREGSERAPASPPVCASPSPTPAPTRVQRQLKASLFVAAYSTNILTDTLDDLAFTLLQGLYAEQRDLKQRQPLQFKARQRFVVGFQEVVKCLRAGRVRLVLLAADVEAVETPEAALQLSSGGTTAPAAAAMAGGEGGCAGSSASLLRPAKPTRRKAFQSLHEAVAQVQQLCRSVPQESASTVPPARAQAPLCVTCMSRQRLSYALYAKGSKIGCVGVMQAEKNRDALKAVVACGRLLTEAYVCRMAESVQDVEREA